MSYRLVGAWLLVTVLMLSACTEKPQKVPATINFELTFVANWWSEDQMEDLNLDDPPPKLAEVSLHRWEASDPVGTPHPEEFEIVAIVKTGSGLGDVQIGVEKRWGIGDLYSGQPTRWSDWTSGGQTVPVDLKAGTNRIPLARVRLDAIQEDLYENEEWPWLFEARAHLTSKRDKSLDLVTSRKLEILAGD